FDQRPTGVLKSVDAGASWESTGLTGFGVSALALDDADPPAIYAAVYEQNEATGWRPVFRGVRKSVDEGVHWTGASRGLGDLIGQGVIATALLAVPGSWRTVYLATAGAGVLRSLDGGASWVAVNEN